MRKLAGIVMMSLVKMVCLIGLKIFGEIKMKFYYINLSQISTFTKYIFSNNDF